jgi:hypothetical protein
MRFMGLLKADRNSEAGTPPSADLMERMGHFIEEIAAAGVLLATDGLQPSAKGKRVRLSNGAFTVTDGPFAEAKELIASYAIFEVKSMDEAVAWTKKFLGVLGEGECEIRPIFEAADFPADVFPPEAMAREEEIRKEMAARAVRR